MKQINIYETEWYPVLVFRDAEGSGYTRYSVEDEEYAELARLETMMTDAYNELEEKLKEIKRRAWA